MEHESLFIGKPSRSATMQKPIVKRESVSRFLKPWQNPAILLCVLPFWESSTIYVSRTAVKRENWVLNCWSSSCGTKQPVSEHVWLTHQKWMQESPRGKYEHGLRLQNCRHYQLHICFGFDVVAQKRHAISRYQASPESPSQWPSGRHFSAPSLYPEEYPKRPQWTGPSCRWAQFLHIPKTSRIKLGLGQSLCIALLLNLHCAQNITLLRNSLLLRNNLQKKRFGTKKKEKTQKDIKAGLRFLIAEDVIFLLGNPGFPYQVKE